MNPGKIVGYVLKTTDGKFAIEDFASGGYLCKSEKPACGGGGKGVFPLDEAKYNVEFWNRPGNLAYGFTNMTIHPLFLGEEVK